MQSSSEPIVLPRGGVIFPASIGSIQYGSVPETIKDTMVLPEGVPSIYVMPERLFSALRGISLAELEFPAYYNFFLKGARIRVVCRREQRAVLETVLGQALFGPPRLDPEEFLGGERHSLPDLASELAYFRRNPAKAGIPMQLEDLVHFVEFDPSGQARLSPEVSVALQDDGGIAIHERGRRSFAWKGEPPLPEPKAAGDGPLRAFRGPALGVSVIGSGHGFDPGNRTSGFIVWIEGEGVMVDPPVDWADWLRGYDLEPRQMNTLILTHCHADHDAGTLQKILQEGRVTIYATPTVLSSFVSKYSALTGIQPQLFRELFDHVPVDTGEPVYLCGAEATFGYSLHTIPCTGFEIRLRDRSLYYPSDTLNDPGRIHSLHDAGVLSKDRRDSLLAFPWHHSLVIHEAGAPPIHTPIEYLASLTEEVKRRMLLIHTSQQSVSDGMGLRVAPTGLDEVTDLVPSPSSQGETLQLLDAMARVQIFSELPIGRGGEFLRMARRRTFEPGETIIKAGTVGEEFFIILTGLAAVLLKGRQIKVYSAFDYIGESSLVLAQPRVADVIARTVVETIVLSRRHFLHLIRGTDLPDRLAKLARHREQMSWALLDWSPVFSTLTANQKDQLEALMEAASLEEGQEVGLDPMLVSDGWLRVGYANQTLTTLQAGSLAGDVARLFHGHSSRYVFAAESPTDGFTFERQGLRRFLRSNPGAYLKLLEVASRWETPGKG